jgi:hypothetical protein
MKHLINSFLILTPALFSAQDLLYKTDNSKLQVKVSEISEATIKYKLFNNPDGPSYVIKKPDVALIIYQNGLHEVFKSQPKEETVAYYSAFAKDTLKDHNRKQKFEKVTQNKNVLFINTVEFLNSGVGISYLREIWDSRISIHVPFAASYKSPVMDDALSALGNNSNNYRLTHTIYDIGLGCYFNTGNKRTITHFIGPLIRNAQYSGTYDQLTNTSSYYFTTNRKPFEMNETSLMINNGFLYRFTPKFNMMINVAIGKFINRKVSGGPESDDGINRDFSRNLALHAGLHFGYRF